MSSMPRHEIPLTGVSLLHKGLMLSRQIKETLSGFGAFVGVICCHRLLTASWVTAIRAASFEGARFGLRAGFDI